MIVISLDICGSSYGGSITRSVNFDVRDGARPAFGAGARAAGGQSGAWCDRVRHRCRAFLLAVYKETCRAAVEDALDIVPGVGVECRL